MAERPRARWFVLAVAAVYVLGALGLVVLVGLVVAVALPW